MMNALGKKRILILATLSVLLAVLSLLAFFVTMPQASKTKKRLDEISANKNQIAIEMEKMRADYITFENQRVLFDKLDKTGFLNDQNRVLTRARFETLQRLSKIVSAKYEIKAAVITENDLSSNTGYVTIQSPISVSLSAIDDLDIYRFVYYLNYGFPGFVKIKELTIERSAEVTPDVLKAIGAGAPPQIITAKMELEWTTMTKKSSIPAEVLLEAAKAQEAMQQ